MDNTTTYRAVITWGVSRGQDTYGYTTCTLRVDGEKVGACNGGGYDMKGTVFGEYLVKKFQARLQAIAHRANSIYDVVPGKDSDTGKPFNSYNRRSEGGDLYGMTAYHRGDVTRVVRVECDGACGISSMMNIAGAIGVGIEYLEETRTKTFYRIHVDENWEAPSA